MSEQFDLIVLGSGSGARDGANKASREPGARVALIESTRWGGSCPNVACKPTKAYLVAAELAYAIETLANRLGIGGILQRRAREAGSASSSRTATTPSVLAPAVVVYCPECAEREQFGR